MLVANPLRVLEQSGRASVRQVSVIAVSLEGCHICVQRRVGVSYRGAEG